VRFVSIIRGPRRVRRVAHIARKAAAHGLGFLIGKLDLQRHLPAWLRLPKRAEEARPEEMASRLASMLEELGPTFVKFGQMLATRPDILPEEYIAEFERICHHVAPFPGEAARAIVAEELGVPVERVFRTFSEEPFASGSIAQVHGATLRDGTAVVVKVRRPRVERTIADDIAILTFLAAQADRVEEFRPLRLPMLVEEFASGIRRELDFLSEAAYTHRFAEGFSDDGRIEIPRVYWDYTTTRVLTMKRVQGTHLGGLLRNWSVPMDRSVVARTIVDAYLRQFFSFGLFHADPHPGNILLTPLGRVALLDFGLVGRLNAGLRRDLSMCMVALSNGQLELVAEILTEIGRLPDERQVDELRAELVDLLERHASVPIEKIDYQRSFRQIMDVLRNYEVDVPRDFVLMGRALVEIGGIVTQLDPQVDVASLARPYGGRLLGQKLSAASLKQGLTSGGYRLAKLIADGPRDARRLMQKLQRGLFEFTVRHEGFEKGLKELDQTGNRLSLSIILAAIIIASSMLLEADIGAVTVFGSRLSLLGIAGLLFGFVLAVWLIVGILRSRRL